MELRQLRTEQESQTVLQLFETIRSGDYIRASRRLDGIPDVLSATEIEKRLSQEDLHVILRLVFTWEALGVRVYRRDVSSEWVNEMLRYNILRSWDKLSPLAYAEREQAGYDGLWEWHEWLADRLRELDQEALVPAYEAHANWAP